MSYLDRIAACNNAQVASFPAFIVNDQIYGYVLPSFAQALAPFSEVFKVSTQDVQLNSTLNTYAERTEAVMGIMRELYQRKVLDSWVGENYPITHSFGGFAEFEVERAATSYLGIQNFGLHVNGLVETPDGIKVWTGTRTLVKPLWPGKLDQMVAGGQPVGISVRDNMLKEAHEEANIPAALAQTATHVRNISYQQQGARGLDRSTIFVFDLWLPADFQPVNTDGEVINFELMTLDQIADLTANTTEFKDNCNLVNIDLLLRLGHISAQHPDYDMINNTLHSRVPTHAH
jgi:8-oxo-dGTP pyrophosphatase MutT (NUDIX family)